ncbi:MAG TPA: alpha-hydroxy acid oxidase [Candidatus Limnocylindrales bacterium]|nr:alpha-hydroxy acid oxidase [Candidatus Limnocylindrales bacterium]
MAELSQPPALSRAVNLSDFETLAAERMGRPELDYVAGGADDELTMAANRAAFARLRLRPRVLVDVSDVDSSTSLLGHPVSLPAAVAPMAFQHFADPQAELATARAASAANVLFCLSTMSSRSIEEVAAAADEAGSGPRWFQLYVHRERRRSAELVRRAAAAGYTAIVLTVDFPVAGNRERDLRWGLPYPQAYGNIEVTRAEAADGVLAAVIGGFTDSTLSWNDLDWLRGLSELPIVVKGILSGEDAQRAVEMGVHGVVVSNHGGRQLDRLPAALDALPEVVRAVDGRVEVYLDGGVRRGTDVLMALALGARATFVGRPIFFALGAGGEAGVAHALDLLRAEVRRDMALLGVSELSQVGAHHLWTPPAPAQSRSR